MKLTPLDIHHKEFRRAIRGYSEEEVDVFLDQVADEFERVFKENIDLKEQIDGMKDKVKQYEGVEHSLHRALLTAQQAADDVQDNATKESELIVKDAELKAKEIIQQVLTEKQNLQGELVGLKSAEREFRDKFKHLLTQYLDVINKVEGGEAPAAIKVPVMPETPGLPEPVVPEAVAEPEPAPAPAPAPEPEPEPEPQSSFEPVQEPERKNESSFFGDTDEKRPSEDSVSTPPEQHFEVPPAAAEAPAQTTAPEVSVFNPYSAPSSQAAPVEAAPPVTSFFDDDLGVDEEEKKDDWSTFPGPTAGD